MKQRIVQIVKFAVSAGLLYYLLQRIGLQNFWNQLRSADAGWLLFGLVIFTVSNVLGALQWHLLLRATGVRLPYGQTLRYYFIGLFFNNFFVSNMGGDFFRLYYISKSAKNGAAAVSTVFLDRFLGFSMLTVLAVLGGLYWMGIQGMGKIWPVLLALLALWAGLLLVLFNRNLGKLLHGVLSWFVPEKFLTKLTAVYNLINEFNQRKKTMLLLIGISLVIQLSRVSIHFIAGRALGVHVSFLAFMVFVPLIALLASLPISIGGLGVREQSGVLLFQRVGVPMQQVVPMELLAYVLTILASLPGMVFYLITGSGKEVQNEST